MLRHHIAASLFACLIVASLTISGPAGAGLATEATCAAAMDRFLKETGNEKFTSTLEDLNSLKMPSLKEVDRRPGQHGGEIIVVERTKDHWASSHTTVAFDLQGDPRWFIQVFTPQVAAFFGFKQLDNKTMTMPDIAELKGAIGKVNDYLTAEGLDPIDLNFFRSTSENTKVNTYLERFIRDKEIPLASEGNHMFHDLSFHVPSIALPRETIEYCAARYKFNLEFTEFLKNKFRNDKTKALPRNEKGGFFSKWFKRKPSPDIDKPQDPARLAAAKFYSFLLKAKMVNEIDNGTGLVAPEFSLYLQARENYLASGQGPPSPSSYFGNAIGRFLGKGWGSPWLYKNNAPADILAQNLVDMLSGRDIYFRPRDQRKQTETKLTEHTEQLAVKDVVDLVYEFAKSYKSDYPGFNAMKPLANADNFVDRQCKAMTERRKAIAEATNRIIQSQQNN